MTRLDFMRSFGLVSLLVLTGCSKGTEEATVATSPPAATSQPATAPQPAAPGAAKPAPASGVVQTSAVAPVEQGDPIVALNTSVGTLYVRLYERQAPRSVANFFDYARTGHYDGTLFHQVDAGFAAIGGAFSTDLKTKPVRYPIRSEAENGLKNVRGSLAMVRDPSDPHSATSMFFINLADNPKLDHTGTMPEQYGFCVFGQVIDGLDVLKKLDALKTEQTAGFTNLPVDRVTLNSIKLLRAVAQRAPAPSAR